MEPEIIYGRLTKIFRDVFDDDDLIVTPTLSAEDIEDWDSVTHIRLVLLVENEFSLRFSAGEIDKLKNVGDLVELIGKKDEQRLKT